MAKKKQKKMTLAKYLKTFDNNSIIFKVFSILKDKKWHCRTCVEAAVKSRQIAGGGGIQGLQRGTKTRPGLEIETKKQKCNACNATTIHDKWTGKYLESVTASSIPKILQTKILKHFNYTDCIENRKRNPNELVIDHRLPMIRWGGIEDKNAPDMTEDQIQEKFQLLKKDSSGNHNLLKSRACENCAKTGKRGSPFGINFFYKGNEDWPDNCPKTGEEAKDGCIGCGWYDFNTWRDVLNSELIKKGE